MAGRPGWQDVQKHGTHVHPQKVLTLDKGDCENAKPIEKVRPDEGIGGRPYVAGVRASKFGHRRCPAPGCPKDGDRSRLDRKERGREARSRCAATGCCSTTAAGGYGRSGSVCGSRFAGFGGIGSGGESSCEGCQQCIPEVATATTGRAAIALQTGADQRKRIQRLEAEDPEFALAVSRVAEQPIPRTGRVVPSACAKFVPVILGGPFGPQVT